MQQFVFQHPILLSPTVQRDLYDSKVLDSGEGRGLTLAWNHLLKQGWLLAKGETEYPVGPGPIEQIDKAQEDGQISADRALALAREPKNANSLSPFYVHVLCQHSVVLAVQGQWRRAVRLHKLMLEAAGVMRQSSESRFALDQVSLDWISVVAIALVDFPDKRLFTSALRAGEDLLKGCHSENRVLRGEILYRLGILHLDPYTARKDLSNYTQAIFWWRKRVTDEFASQFAPPAPDELSMVEPGDALLAAEQYFREALRSQEGVSRGKALKALVQTVEARQSLFNVSPQPQEIIDCCREALDLLPPAQEPRKNLELLRTLEKYASLTVEEIERHLPSLQSLMRDWDCREQVGIVIEYAALFFGACTSKSLGVLTAARSLFEQHGSEAQRWSRWGMQLSLLGTTITLQKSIVATASKNVERAASVVRAQAKDEGWNDHVLASALLKLSILSANNNQEAAGLALAEEATKLSSALGAEVGDAIEHLKSELTFGIGVNQYNAGDRSNAIRLYGISMEHHLHWNLPEHAMRDLHRIADLACSKKVGKAEQRRQIVHSGIAVLRANALRAELELGAQGTQIIQGMCQQLVAASSEVGLDLDAKLSLFQIAKGFRSAAAIKVKGKYDKNNDEEGSILRTKIIDAEMEIVKANQNTLPLSHRLDDFLLVSPCTYSDQPLPGVSPHERLLNLQRTYDEHVYRRLFTGDVNPDVVMQDEVQLRSAVPEKTVLLDFYLGKMTDGRSACFARQITREEIRSADISRTASLADNITIGHDDLRVRLSTFELLVQEVREAILQDPDGNPVSEKGGEDLRWDAKGYLAQFLDLADSLRSSGKNHVCIVPHGALQDRKST